MNRFAPKAIVATFAVAFAPIATAQTSDWFPLQVNAIAADGTKTQVAYTPHPGQHEYDDADPFGANA